MRSEGPVGWTSAPLGEHVDLLVGFAFKSAEFTDDPDGIRLLRGDNVGQGRLRWNSPRRWPFERRSEFERYELRTGDIVLAMDRPWIDAGLKYAMVRNEDVPCLLVQRVARLRGGDTLSQQYLRYLIASPNFTSWVKAVQTGTAVPHISGGQIADYPFPLPPRPEQVRISSVLGALDDKIDSNRRLARLLEQIAQEEFRARFVDFVGIDQFDQRSTGPAPLGWEWRPLSDLARYVNGKAFTKFGNGRGRMVIRIADLKSGPGGSTVYSDHEPDSDDFFARPGDLLFAWSGSLDVYRWYREEALINQHIFKVVPKDVPPWLVYFALKHLMPHFQAIAADKATTMGHIKRADIAHFGVPVPPHEQLQQFDSFFLPIFDQSLGAHTEVDTLACIRDALLPKLISGEIRVPDTGDPAEVIQPLVDGAS